MDNMVELNRKEIEIVAGGYCVCICKRNDSEYTGIWKCVGLVQNVQSCVGICHKKEVIGKWVMGCCISILEQVIGSLLPQEPRF